jgi:hypothetical protein
LHAKIFVDLEQALLVRGRFGEQRSPRIASEKSGGGGFRAGDSINAPAASRTPSKGLS